jgi:chemotaxis protein methyltransferase CheR
VIQTAGQGQGTASWQSSSTICRFSGTLRVASRLPQRRIVTDADCVAFLQWALPRLGLRWQGYRRVRKQVCKRIDRRIRIVKVNGLAAYKAYLDEHAGEWAALEALCSIPISRFYRDRAVFDMLGEQILPELAERAAARASAVVRCWSAGCASGEEPYTISLLWDQRVLPRHPHARLTIVATDVDEHLLARARAACYSKGSLRELPAGWIEQAFDRRDGLYCLRDHWKACVEFRHQDIRVEQPAGEFDLVLCRNVALTYFAEPAQRAVLAHIAERLNADGFLVVGRHESVPIDAPFVGAPSMLGIFRKAAERHPWVNADVVVGANR